MESTLETPVPPPFLQTQPPKKSRTPFWYFYMQQKKSFISEQSNGPSKFSAAEIYKVINKKWASLSEKDREAYTSKADTGRTRLQHFSSPPTAPTCQASTGDKNPRSTTKLTGRKRAANNLKEAVTFATATANCIPPASKKRARHNQEVSSDLAKTTDFDRYPVRCGGNDQLQQRGRKSKLWQQRREVGDHLHEEEELSPLSQSKESNKETAEEKDKLDEDMETFSLCSEDNDVVFVNRGGGKKLKGKGKGGGGGGGRRGRDRIDSEEDESEIENEMEEEEEVKDSNTQKVQQKQQKQQHPRRRHRTATTTTSSHPAKLPITSSSAQKATSATVLSKGTQAEDQLQRLKPVRMGGQPPSKTSTRKRDRKQNYHRAVRKLYQSKKNTKSHCWWATYYLK